MAQRDQAAFDRRGCAKDAIEAPEVHRFASGRRRLLETEMR
jgi:hypothetical protein